jgi:hypothetical protein
LQEAGASSARRHLFDGHVLAEYIVSQVGRCLLNTQRKSLAVFQPKVWLFS